MPFEFQRGYRALEALCPHPASEIPGRIGRTGLARLLETGSITPQAFVQDLSRELEIRVTFEEFCDLWNSIFLPETLIPDEMIAGLASRFRVVLLSNTNRIHFESIRAKYPILRHFHAFVLSYEVGMMKPEPAIFEHAASIAGCQPSACLFIDDLEENVEGARRTGMQAIRFQNLRQLEDDLTARGIRWSAD